MSPNVKFQALEGTQKERESLENIFLPGFLNSDAFSNISHFK